MTGNLEKVLQGKNNLYLLTFFGHGMKFCYVVAPDPTSAQNKVTAAMVSDNYGFSSERVVKSITLIAEDVLCSATGAWLFV